MRKSLTLKMLLRSPLKTLLTFLLIAAASFTLFSRVTDYVITNRETANAEKFYHGVAALDNTVPDIMVSGEKEGVFFSIGHETENKPWPEEEKIKEFSSLPGVTLADTRYMTAGLVEDYKRLVDEHSSAYSLGRFVLEGTYIGYEEVSGAESTIELVFDDVVVIAGEIEVESEKTVKINHICIEEDLEGVKNPYSQKYFDELEKGSRCLLKGKYTDTSGQGLETNIQQEGDFCILDGVGEDYLETKQFAVYKELVEAIKQSLYTYDIVYTSDMRAIPRFNERKMIMSKGRPLKEDDKDTCVVSDLFLKTNHLSIGDKVNVKFGDRLFAQDPLHGARADYKGNLSRFVGEAELEIVGAYQFNDDMQMRVSEFDWSYTSSTVFVPKSLLPIDVPDDYIPSMGEFSIFVENAQDIEAFQEAAEPLAAEMGVALRLSDGGWLNIKDSFERGSLISFLSAILYIAGSALALLLAIYFYVGWNKKTYAIMRTMGVSAEMAGNSLILPLVVLSAFAMPAGIMAGLFYSLKIMTVAFASMTENSPDGYVLDITPPIGQIIMCLLFELAFMSFIALFFLQKMNKIPTMKLQQVAAVQAAADTSTAPKSIGTIISPAELDITKIPISHEVPLGGKYSALHHVAAYVLCHVRRGIKKAMILLLVTVVMTAGIGVYGLSKITYQDAFYKLDVKGKAMEFASSSIIELLKSELAENVYYYNTLSVYVDGIGLKIPMTFTNDFERYLEKDHTITYAEGYDNSIFDGTGSVCLLGQALAKEIGVSPGDEIALLTNDIYLFMRELYEDEESFQTAVAQAGKEYKVVGILESGDEDVSGSIFAAANDAAEMLYGQPFPISYCEFKLADNRRLDELNILLDDQRAQEMKYAPMASYHIDSEGLKNVEQICSLLELIFPIAAVAAAAVGLLGSGLAILQSAREAAFLRILGVTKKRARCMLMLEQVLLCAAGIIFVVCGLALYSPGIFARSTETFAFCCALYFLGCLCGAAAAAVYVTRGRVLELLQVKE